MAKKNMRKPNRRRFRNTRQNSNFAWDYNGNDLSPADEKLLTAASEGDIAGVKSALKAGANVNVEDDTGYTPLDLATGEGDFEVVKVLVQAGANLNTPYNPFLNAVFIDRNMARYLAQRGVDINGTGNSGDTALETAIYNGDARDVSFLLDLGVDPNFDNPDSYLLGGRSPVIYAAQTGLLEILKLLVEAGADVPEEALELAEEEGCTKTASYLRQLMSEDRGRGHRGRRRHGRHFSRADDIENEGNSLDEKVRIINEWFGTWDEDDPSSDMLSAEEIIEAIDNFVRTDNRYYRNKLAGDPYLKAACKQIVAVLSYLLGETTERPKSLAVYEPAEMIASEVNMSDYTPLKRFREAIKNCDYNQVEMLIEEGVDCSKKDLNGRNSLHYAVRYGSSEIINLIMEHEGIDIEEETSSGMTPLMIAVDADNWDAVDALLDAGAYINHDSENYGTPIDVARSNGNEKLVIHILDRINGLI